MVKTMKKIISVFLVVLMCITATPLNGLTGIDLGFTANAEYSLPLGTNITSTIDTTGVLTITGSGAIPDYDANTKPFYRFRDTIKSVKIDSRITSIGDYLFYDMSSIESVTFDSGSQLSSIGRSAFYNCISLYNLVIPESVVTIDILAFYNCRSLTTVSFGRSLSNIQSSAFYDCDSLKTVNYSGCMGQWQKVYIATYNEPIKTANIVCTGHNFSTPTTLTDADCLNGGVASYKKCSLCNLYYGADETVQSENGKESISAFNIAAKGHTFVNDVEAKDPDCVHDGKYAYKQCENCNLYFGVDEETDSTNGKENASAFDIEATGHTFVNEVTAKAPDCLHDGNYAYKQCENCNLYFGASETVESENGKENNQSFIRDKIDHSYTGDLLSNGNGKDATHSHKCVNGCNEYGGETAHIWNDGEETKAPTHLEFGEMTYTCECGATYTEPVDKISKHTYKETVVLPTCTEKGYTIHTCECGDSYIDNYVDALGHSYKEGKCTACGAVDENYVPVADCDCSCHDNSIFAKLIRLMYSIISLISFKRVTCCPDMEYLLDIGDIT